MQRGFGLVALEFQFSLVYAGDDLTAADRTAEINAYRFKISRSLARNRHLVLSFKRANDFDAAIGAALDNRCG